MESNTHLPLDPPSTSRSAIPAPIPVPAFPTILAADGSEVRVLSSTSRASTATFRLAAHQTSVGVVHRTVDEIWYVVSGSGSIWRCWSPLPPPAAAADQGKETPPPPPNPGVEDRLVPGVSVAIPVGTHFQFRAEGEGLEILGVTVRAWPGEEEAVLSDLTPWKGGVGVKV